jgi:ABC-type sugar transport system substrate-binding protein
VADQPQAAVPLKLITKKLTFIFVPKLVYPYICGKYVAEKLGKKGKAAILLGSLTSPEHQGRVQGFKKAIQW